MKSLADQFFSVFFIKNECQILQKPLENKGVPSALLEVDSLNSLIEPLHKPQEDVNLKCILEKLNTAFDTGVLLRVENQEGASDCFTLSGVQCMDIFCQDYRNIFMVIRTFWRRRLVVLSAVDVITKLILFRYVKGCSFFRVNACN